MFTSSLLDEIIIFNSHVKLMVDYEVRDTIGKHIKIQDNEEISRICSFITSQIKDNDCSITSILKHHLYKQQKYNNNNIVRCVFAINKTHHYIFYFRFDVIEQKFKIKLYEQQISLPKNNRRGRRKKRKLKEEDVWWYEL